MTPTVDSIRSEAIEAIQTISRAAIASIHDLVDESAAVTAAAAEAIKKQLEATKTPSGLGPDDNAAIQLVGTAAPSAADLDAHAAETEAKQATSLDSAPDAPGDAAIDPAGEEKEESVKRAVPRLSPNDLIRGATGQPAQKEAPASQSPNQVIASTAPTLLATEPDPESSSPGAPSASTSDEAAQPNTGTGDGAGGAAQEPAPVA